MDIQYQIATNKFYPPQIDSSHTLFRKQLIVGLLSREIDSTRIISVVAQAGQGKTTLALQFLEYNKLNYAWYQIGREDQDPVQMFASLLKCLMMAVPHFKPESVIDLVNDGDLSLDNLYHVVGIFSTELSNAITKDIYIVLDDLHLLLGSPTLALLEYLLCSSSPHIKFLLLGRQPLPIKFDSHSDMPQVLEVGEGSMTLSVTESMKLLNQVLEIDIPWSKVAEIHKLTEGWMMGQIMIASALQENSATIHDIESLAANSGLNSYLKNEIFTHLPATLSKKVAKLSLLDEIEIPLAIELTGDPKISKNIQKYPKISKGLTNVTIFCGNWTVTPKPFDCTISVETFYGRRLLNCWVRRVSPQH